MKLTVNGNEREVEDGRTLSDLLDQMELDEDRVAVEVDRNVVSGDEYSTFELEEGNEVEIVTFVGGG